jgi:hypothetical protein
MGLDTSHDAWHGPYSAFSRWRDTVARAAGYSVISTKDGTGWVHDEVDLPWHMFRHENYMGEWGNGPVIEDPLLYLIVHSDCDGVIHPSEGVHIAARLEQLLPSIPEELPTRPDWIRDKTQRFIDGLRLAAKAGEDVEFH